MSRHILFITLGVVIGSVSRFLLVSRIAKVFRSFFRSEPFLSKCLAVLSRVRLSALLNAFFGYIKTGEYS